MASKINPNHLPLFQTIKVYADQANGISAQIVAATSDTDTLVKNTLKTSSHPDIVKWRKGEETLAAQIKAAREQLAEAHEAALKAAKENTVVADVPEGFSVEDATKEFLAARSAAHVLRKTIKDLSGGDEAYLAAAYDELGIVEVVSPKGTAVKGATGSIKPRLNSASVDGTDVTPATFTNLAKTLKVSLDDLRKAVVAAFGVEDIRNRPNEDVEFVIGTQTIVVNVKPKAGADEDDKSETTDETTDETTETVEVPKV